MESPVECLDKDSKLLFYRGAFNYCLFNSSKKVLDKSSELFFVGALRGYLSWGVLN